MGREESGVREEREWGERRVGERREWGDREWEWGEERVL